TSELATPLPPVNGECSRLDEQDNARMPRPTPNARRMETPPPAHCARACEGRYDRSSKAFRSSLTILPQRAACSLRSPRSPAECQLPGEWHPSRPRRRHLRFPSITMATSPAVEEPRVSGHLRSRYGDARLEPLPHQWFVRRSGGSPALRRRGAF